MLPRVLIIESDTAFLQNLAHRLRQSNMTVFEAEDQAHAESVLQEHEVEVVLLDLSGLKQTGLKLLRRIKESWPDVELITFNSPVQTGLSIEAMKMGAFSDLTIPFDMESLLESIRNAYRRRVDS